MFEVPVGCVFVRLDAVNRILSSRIRMSQNIAAVSVRLIYCKESIRMAVHEVLIRPLFVYTQTVALEVGTTAN